MALEIPRRRHSAEDQDAREVALGTNVDLQMAAEAMRDQAASIAVLARGLSPDGILQSETFALDSAGMGQMQSHVPAHSIAVVNLGTTVLTVSNSPLGASPPGPGRGTLKVLPGHAVCVPLIGMAHAFWGRPGELVTAVRYKTLQPPSFADVGGSWFPVVLPALVVGVATVVYTTPWRDKAYYGGVELRDITATPGAGDSSELVITDGNGVEIDSANFSGKESNEDTFARPVLTTSNTIVATLVKGAVAGAIKVW